jgi:phenylalanine-4-hydroxylase
MDKLLEGHGKDYHAEGFGSPAGKLKGISKPLELMTDGDLEEYGISSNKTVNLEFESGVVVKGFLERVTREKGKILLLSFTDCTVTFRDRVLFEPGWGTYDMAVGERIVSAFSGPADPNGFGLQFPVPKEKTIKIEHTKEARRLHELYKKVRDIRVNGCTAEMVKDLWDAVNKEYPEEWLLKMEILELTVENNLNSGIAEEIKNQLLRLKEDKPDYSNLIDNGFELIYRS